MNVLVIVGHPRKDSLCGALATAFVKGAREAGIAVRELWLSDLNFDPYVRKVSPADQLDDDITLAQGLIQWADHLVFVYPNWWGTMPALLKGFLDRVLTPNFAFVCRKDGGWDRLLVGKSAQLITTMDMSQWVYRLIYRQPGNNAMRRSTLGFCGLRTTRILNLGPIKDANAAQREQWLGTAKKEGLRLGYGILTPFQKASDKAFAWLKALRLHFYPLAWVAYSIGALGAVSNGRQFASDAYWVGYLVLFFLEVVTVLSNEYYDFDTDRRNRNHGPITGGSRILVDKLLSFREVRAGIGFALALATGLAGWLIWQCDVPISASVTVLVVLFVIAPGYTTPPLKLVYRGLGELNVGITHSIGVLLCGYVFQGGLWNDPFPWLVSVPLFFSILPAIILSSIPDYTADKAASKNTLSVIYGPRRAIFLAIACAVLAILSAAILRQDNAVNVLFGLWVYTAFLHAVVLVVILSSYSRQYRQPGRIDGLMIISLSYTVWFGVSPLIALI